VPSDRETMSHDLSRPLWRLGTESRGQASWYAKIRQAAKTGKVVCKDRHAGMQMEPVFVAWYANGACLCKWSMCIGAAELWVGAHRAQRESCRVG